LDLLTRYQDLEEAFDEEIAALKIRMEQACEADNSAREKGQPAIHKLKMLPEVVALLNRNTIQHSIVDPDTNFLQSVKFFLEPLNDGSLPAYNIQRDLFAALTRLPIEKEALLSSGIGKVVLYYTKSKKPEIGIKRTAERLLGEWSRPILKRSDDYKKRKVMSKEFDHQFVFDPPIQRWLANQAIELLNLQFARPVPNHRKSLLHNEQVYRSVSSNGSAFSPSQPQAAEQGWTPQMLATRSLQRAPLILAKVWIQIRGRLVLVVWRPSER
jgi:hypothetical protein